MTAPRPGAADSRLGLATGFGPVRRGPAGGSRSCNTPPAVNRCKEKEQ